MADEKDKVVGAICRVFEDVVDHGLNDLKAKLSAVVERQARIETKIDQRAAEIDATIKHLVEQLRALNANNTPDAQLRIGALQMAIARANGTVTGGREIVDAATEFHAFLTGHLKHDA